MGKLLELVNRYRTADKLRLGRCGNCGAILRDDHPKDAPLACSQWCADEAWDKAQW